MDNSDVIATRHLWEITSSKIESVAGAKSKLKKGWRLLTLSQPYGTWGGIAEITHALLSDTGELRVLSAKSMSQLEATPSGRLEADTKVLALDITYEERLEAKQLGALWLSHKKRWCIKPHQAELFQRWLPETPTVLDILEPQKKKTSQDARS